MKVSVSQNYKYNSFKGQDKLTPVEIKGSQTSAKVYTQNIDYSTYDQVKTICSHPVFKDIPIRIMPDTHAGKNTVVGFTAPVNANRNIIPSLISGDIGCGMLCVNVDIKDKNIDFKKLDEVIRKYVSTAREEIPQSYEQYTKEIIKKISDLCKHKYKVSAENSLSNLGTLGGGNHFIELETDKDGEIYLTIHSGSRRFGNEVFNYHNEVAKKQNPYKIKDLSYLSGAEAKDYLEDMKFAEQYSQINRRIIAEEIIKKMGWKKKSSFESIHNYISSDGIIRKGAISANEGEKLIIPLNMRDGVIIAKGKGNKDWNNSAPHGAGRQFKRGDAAQCISLNDYVDAMRGIYSSCISKSTIDESPQAYKNSEEIIDNIKDTATIDTIAKPIFNYKD